jgi:hypothetical protein
LRNDKPIQHLTMPKGPKGEKRPADVIGRAVKVMRIATGEEEESDPNERKDPAAVAMGKKGGTVRALQLTSEQRKDIASVAAAARWKKGSD